MDRDRTAQAGWDLMNYVALSGEDVPEGFFEAEVALIAERIESYGNWTRRSASNTITGNWTASASPIRRHSSLEAATATNTEVMQT